jgi:hypothetical protein
MVEAERVRTNIGKAAEREQLRQVVHDYDNILAVVAGSVELALRKLARGEPIEVERYLQRANAAVRRGAALSSNIIASSQSCDEGVPLTEGFSPAT